MNNPDKSLTPVNLANKLVADGEIALGLGLKKPVHHKQRCLWHIPHDLGLLMKYQDKTEQEDVNYAMDKVGPFLPFN